MDVFELLNALPASERTRWYGLAAAVPVVMLLGLWLEGRWFARSGRAGSGLGPLEVEQPAASSSGVPSGDSSSACVAGSSPRGSSPDAAMPRGSGRVEARPGSSPGPGPGSELPWRRRAGSRKAGRCSSPASGWNRRAAAEASSPVRKSRGRRQGRSWAWADHRAAGARPQARPHALGSATQKVAPSPGAEITPIEPPCNSTNRLASARPTPCPSTVERSRPRRLKGSNSCACF